MPMTHMGVWWKRLQHWPASLLDLLLRSMRLGGVLLLLFFALRQFVPCVWQGEKLGVCAAASIGQFWHDTGEIPMRVLGWLSGGLSDDQRNRRHQ